MGFRGSVVVAVYGLSVTITGNVYVYRQNNSVTVHLTIYNTDYFPLKNEQSWVHLSLTSSQLKENMNNIPKPAAY